MDPLTRPYERNVLTVGGTMLGTARFHPHRHDGGIEAVHATVEQERIEALICIGGGGTLGGAERDAGSRAEAVGIRKTVDKEVCGTEYPRRCKSAHHSR